MGARAKSPEDVREIPTTGTLYFLRVDGGSRDIATYERMKKSKLQRKFVSQMRAMSDVPWPARRFRYPPMSGLLASRHVELAVPCNRKVGEAKAKTSRFKRKQTVDVPCGGRLIAKLGRTGKRRVYCESCRARTRQRRLERRIELQLQNRFGIGREEERRLSRFSKFRGSR